MKKTTLIISSLIILAGVIFYSCIKEEQVASVTFKKNNLFEKLLTKESTDKNSIIHLTDFSNSLLSLNITSIDILEKSDDQLTIQVFADSLISNGIDYLLNGKIFTISRIDNTYTISCKNCSTPIIYNFQKNSFYINIFNSNINVNNLDSIVITDDVSNDFIVQLTILHEFVQEDLVINYTQTNKSKHVGTGIGFHLGLADAKFFCQRDFDRALKSHPGWWSPGISYSCIFGEHFCMCTCNFYQN